MTLSQKTAYKFVLVLAMDECKIADGVIYIYW